MQKDGIFSHQSKQGLDGQIILNSRMMVKKVGLSAKSILESALKSKGMTIFKRVSHSAGAAKVGLELRSTELLIFGNPKVGTLLMQCQQLAALDLPQKALVYEDENGQVWYAYNDPEYIAYRHNVVGCDDVVSKISKALFNFSKAATQ